MLSNFIYLTDFKWDHSAAEQSVYMPCCLVCVNLIKKYGEYIYDIPQLCKVCDFSDSLVPIIDFCKIL